MCSIYANADFGCYQTTNSPYVILTNGEQRLNNHTWNDDLCRSKFHAGYVNGQGALADTAFRHHIAIPCIFRIPIYGYTEMLLRGN